MFANRCKKILAKYANKEIIKCSNGANCFGIQSKGFSQIRGNGVLLLTITEIIFEFWLPKKEIEIPLKSITKIEKTKWFLKKSKGVQLLKIIFINELENEDAIAWYVRNLDDWILTIEKIAMKKLFIQT